MGGRRLLIATAVGILAMPPLTWSAPSALEHIAYGEEALTYASGVIRESLPIHGLISGISGDNETTGNRRLLAKGDTIYLSMKRPQAISPGDLYTVYRLVHRVSHPASGRDLGTLFVMLAVVEVIEASQEPVTGKVAVQSYGTVVPGDRVMRFVPPRPPEGDRNARQPGDEGMIVELPLGRTLTAQGDVVFVDWGQDKGLRGGDRLEVFRHSPGLPRRLIGELKVLHAAKETSSARVTRSTYPYRLGDRIRFKEAAPELAEQEPVEPVESVQGEGGEPQKVARVPGPGEEVGREEEQRTALLEGLLDHLEFASGEVAIEPEGIEILDQVSKLLKDVTDQHVRVEGHTDNVEIGPTLKHTYPSNWELSKARATEVVRYLVEEGGIDAAGLSAVGHADTQPVASNVDEEGRRKNRRVEIVVYSSNPADAVPDKSPDSELAPVLEEAPFSVEEGDVTPAPLPEEAPVPSPMDEAKAVPDEPLGSEREPVMEDTSFTVEEGDVTPVPLPEEAPIPPPVDEAKAVPDEPLGSEREPVMEDTSFTVEEGDVTPVPLPEEAPIPPPVDERDSFPPAQDVAPFPPGEPSP